MPEILTGEMSQEWMPVHLPGSPGPSSACSVRSWDLVFASSPGADISRAAGCEGVNSSVGTNANLPSLLDTHLESETVVVQS